MIVHESKDSFQFCCTLELERALNQAGIFFAASVGPVLQDGALVKAPKGATIEPFSIFPTGDICRAGFASFMGSHLGTLAQVGRYCSIGEDVHVFGQNHPMDRITTHAFTYKSNPVFNSPELPGPGITGIKRTRRGDRRLPVLEHDVWIGRGASLARDIRLGTGCVVGGGAVVVKDVPPYGIVAGNPAKLIRFRFTETQREKLLASRWWIYAMTQLGGLPFGNPDAFVDALADRIAKDALVPYKPEKIDVFKLVTDFAQARAPVKTKASWYDVRSMLSWLKTMRRPLRFTRQRRKGVVP
jgi:virginiamycin A acetyltransferase